jgi:thiamine biosynthesis protein ThiI
MAREDRAILVRYGEVWLKSDSVRRQFEQVLAGNMKSLFSTGTRISVVPGRTWIHSAKAPKELGRVFGVVSFSPVVVCDKNIEAIKAAARQITKVWKSGTFAIRASRTDKSFPLNSKQLEIAVAELVHLPVDLSDPKHTLSIEIRDHAYLYDRTVAGPGGMPLGSAGKVAAHLRDADDLMAAWMLMKRGALTILICGHSASGGMLHVNKLHEACFTKPKLALLKLLQKWSVGRKLKAARSLKEAIKFGAIALVDVRSNKPKENGLIILNPLVGFSDGEKARLLKKIKQG